MADDAGTEDMIARVRGLRQAAVFAIENGDYETAYTKILAAKVWIDTGPTETEKEAMRMAFRDCEPLLKRVEKERDKAASSGKLKRVDVHHRAPRNCDC